MSHGQVYGRTGSDTHTHTHTHKEPCFRRDEDHGRGIGIGTDKIIGSNEFEDHWRVQGAWVATIRIAAEQFLKGK